MVVLRATLGRIVRIFCWLFAGSVVLGVAGLGFMFYAFMTSPMYPEHCDYYECRGQLEVPNVPVRSDEPLPLPPWRWSTEPARMEHQVCDGEWVLGCEPAMWCDGVLQTRTLTDHLDDEPDPRAILTLSRFDLEAGEQQSCEATLRPPPGTELRIHPNDFSVVIFGRNESTLYSWQYDRDCRLVDEWQLPANLLYAQPIDFREPPLHPRFRASGHGVYFKTIDDCSSASCQLRIWEVYKPRASEHVLHGPDGVSTGYTADYIWWAYRQGALWYINVIDRTTREPVFSTNGRMSEPLTDSPVLGVRIVDDRLTLELERSASALGALTSEPDGPWFEIRVYDLASGEVEANLVTLEKLQFSGRDLRPRWNDDGGASRLR